MKENSNIRVFSKRDSRITVGSIVLVCVIFLLQVFLLYRLYHSSLDLLQRELNLAVDEIYKADLSRRLQKLSRGKSPDIQFFGEKKPDAVTDTTKVTTINAAKTGNTQGQVSVTTVNAAIEEYVSKSEPIRLQTLDSIAAKCFERRGIKNSFYSEIIDVEKNRVLKSSLLPKRHPLQTLSSNDLPINAAQTKVLRITLINPLSADYIQMGGMLILSILLCIICIYSFYVHRRSLAKQRQINRLKSDLFSDISHEFKKPLQTLSMVISGFEDDRIMENDEKRGRYVKMGVAEIVKMNTQVEMILATTQEDEGFLELHYSRFDLTEETNIVAKHFLDTTLSILEIDVIDNMRGNSYIEADKDHISLVISNLVENAIKYSDPPSTIVINLLRDNNNIYISVKDNGIGISPEDQPHIFDRYSRARQSQVKAKGHGIGLDYSKRMVEKHGGEISVVSELNKGSEFVIRLPQKK